MALPGFLGVEHSPESQHWGPLAAALPPEFSVLSRVPEASSGTATVLEESLDQGQLIAAHPETTLATDALQLRYGVDAVGWVGPGPKEIDDMGEDRGRQVDHGGC